MDATLSREPRRRSVRLPDGDMSLLDFGDPRRPVDVVFAHANGFHAQTYRSILQPLSAGLRILAVDLRGHGETRLPADPRRLRSWTVYARDLSTLLMGLEGPRPVLAGHSMGATSMLLAAGRTPGLSRSLVLFEPVILRRWRSLSAHLPWATALLRRRFPMAVKAAARRAVFESREAAFKAYRGRGAFKRWPDALLADYVGGGFHARAEGGVELACAPAWEAANFAAQAADPLSAIGRAGVPVVILKAEHGSTCQTPTPSLRKRGAVVKIVPGSSHFLPMERPDVVRQFLLDAAER